MSQWKNTEKMYVKPILTSNNISLTLLVSTKGHTHMIKLDDYANNKYICLLRFVITYKISVSPCQHAKLHYHCIAQELFLLLVGL